MAGFSGGCQCGAVRFHSSEPPHSVNICHCAMCRRATAGVWSAFAHAKDETVTVEGEPALFASSDRAERAFCPSCGTPLWYRVVPGDQYEFMLGALDRPETITPDYHYAPEFAVPWLDRLDGLPRRPLDQDEPVSSRQAAIPTGDRS